MPVKKLKPMLKKGALCVIKGCCSRHGYAIGSTVKVHRLATEYESDEHDYHVYEMKLVDPKTGKLAKDQPAGPYVRDCDFDIVATEESSPTDTKLYDVDEDFLKQAYKEASEQQREKIRKWVPAAFESVVFDFRGKGEEELSLFATETKNGLPFYIGKNHAPRGLEQKCLVLKEGVEVEVLENQESPYTKNRTVLVFRNKSIF